MRWERVESVRISRIASSASILRTSALATILDILDHIQKRPRMYWGRSLPPLEIFCHGYYAALSTRHIQEPVPVVGTFHFGEWLYRRYKWPHACGWAEAIRTQCETDEEAFDKFFSLLEEYRQLRPVMYGVIALGPAHQPTGARTRGDGSWPLPPKRLEVYRYEPEDFYFLVEHYPDGMDDRSTFGSLELAFAHAERHWQIKSTEWDGTRS